MAALCLAASASADASFTHLPTEPGAAGAGDFGGAMYDYWFLLGAILYISLAAQRRRRDWLAIMRGAGDIARQSIEVRAFRAEMPGSLRVDDDER